MERLQSESWRCQIAVPGKSHRNDKANESGVRLGVVLNTAVLKLKSTAYLLDFAGKTGLPSPNGPSN